MGKSTPSPPPPPDPIEIARADARFNRIDQFTPFGNLVFSGPDRNRATLSLTPEVQALQDQRFQSDANVLGQALQRQGMLDPNPIDLSQFGPIQTEIDQSNIDFRGPDVPGLPGLSNPGFVGGVGPQGPIQGSINQTLPISNQLALADLPALPSDIEGFRTDVEDAIFDRGRRLLDPVFSDQEMRLNQRLATQGLPRGGEAVNRDLTRFEDARNRAFVELADQATIGAGAQASRLLGDTLATRGQGFNEALSSGGFSNQAAAQNLAQLAAQGGFQNQAQQQGFGQAMAQAGLANQAGLLGLGADQQNRQQLFGESLALNQAQNQAAAQNLALQQQMLQNRNAGRVQGVNEAQAIRGNQFNELASLLGLQQVQSPSLQNFFAPSQADVVSGFGLQQQQLQNNFNQQMAQRNAGLGGLFGLGSAAIMGPLANIFAPTPNTVYNLPGG